MNILAGILLFFVLEKLVLWRHCHDEGCAGHEPHTTATGMAATSTAAAAC
jgi:zinc and cadmium transporter